MKNKNKKLILFYDLWTWESPKPEVGIEDFWENLVSLVLGARVNRQNRRFELKSTPGP